MKIKNFYKICILIGILTGIASVIKSDKLLMIISFAFLLVPTLTAVLTGAPFVPTPMKAAEKMLQLAKIKHGNTVIDIGCGDGRLAYIAANKWGAKAIGYELSPIIYILAKIRQILWHSKAKIKFADFRKQNLTDTDYIVCYLLPDTLKKFIPKFEKELKQGAKIISYAFPIEGWTPVHVEDRVPEENISPIWIYEIGKQ
jgi:SAM-dependent methyltransferase